ncbi:MAG: outer membrane beta-barrel protein, partial [Bacteroidota bacterium]
MKTKKYHILGLCLIVWQVWLPTYAQEGSITGMVRDKETSAPLPYAMIVLSRSVDSLPVTEILTDSTGSFTLQHLAWDRYILRASFWGFESVALNLNLSQASLPLGEILLSPSSSLLEAIEITGRTSKSYLTVDRQVYDAEQFQNSQGGSALDIVRNLPSVTVDIQGQISLRGSQGLRVMIDGRQVETDPITLLNQLPANHVEHIEVLTTPSAQYDPDGQGGIIHIQTKSGLADGFSLLVNGRYGLPSLAQYDNREATRRFGGDVTVNWRKGVWDLTLGADYRRNDIAGRREGYVNTFQNGIFTEFPSSGERSYDNIQYSGRFSLRYQPDLKHTVSLRFFAGDRTKYRTADIRYTNQQRRSIDPNAFLGAKTYWEQYQQMKRGTEQGTLLHSLTYFNKNLRVREGDFLIGGLDYRWQLPSNIQLDLSALAERTVLGGPTDNVSLAWPNISDTLQYQFNTNDNPLDGIRLRADIQQEVKDLIWKVGYQYRYLFHPGDFLYLDRDLERDIFQVNPLFSNQIELTRQIHGGYFLVSHKWKQLSYQAGLRLEYMDRQVRLAQPDTTYTYEIFQPFPSLNLAYHLPKGWILRGGYSRRIERATT